jgi:hypothetical protein
MATFLIAPESLQSTCGARCGRFGSVSVGDPHSPDFVLGRFVHMKIVAPNGEIGQPTGGCWRERQTKNQRLLAIEECSVTRLLGPSPPPEPITLIISIEDSFTLDRRPSLGIRNVDPCHQIVAL